MPSLREAFPSQPWAQLRAQGAPSMSSPPCNPTTSLSFSRCSWEYFWLWVSTALRCSSFSPLCCSCRSRNCFLTSSCWFWGRVKPKPKTWEQTLKRSERSHFCLPKFHNLWCIFLSVPPKPNWAGLDGRQSPSYR